MDTESMNEKDVTVDELEDTVKRTDQQLALMVWKMDSADQALVPVTPQDACVMNLMKSVSEVRADYRALRVELEEVQALQRELSARLRAQLRTVHGKFARLRQRLAQVPPPPHQAH